MQHLCLLTRSNRIPTKLVLKYLHIYQMRLENKFLERRIKYVLDAK